MKISLNEANKVQRELDDAWATMIKSRDEWRCAICGDDRRVYAHHIIPRENKEFRYCEDNGISLCVTHHKFNRVISAHNAPLAFFLWLQRFHVNSSVAACERIKRLLKENGIQI